MRAVFFKYLLIFLVFCGMAIVNLGLCVVLDCGLFVIYDRYKHVTEILESPDEWISVKCPECGRVHWINKSWYDDYLARTGFSRSYFFHFYQLFCGSGCDFVGTLDEYDKGPEVPF